MFTRKPVQMSVSEKIEHFDDASSRALDAFTAAALELEICADGLRALAGEARQEVGKLLNYAEYAEEGAARNANRAAKIRALTE